MGMEADPGVSARRSPGSGRAALQNSPSRLEARSAPFPVPSSHPGRRLPPGHRPLAVAGAALIALSALGCSGSVSGGAKTADDGRERRDVAIEHEECDIDSSSAERIDANGDGRPDVTIVSDGGREVCRAVDLNVDGVVDAWVYRDGAGNVRRRELDYDRDGRIEEIQIYKNGVLVEKHRATTLAHKLDTWHHYEGGRLARTERDANGDQIIDQWWEYPRPECPMIHSDINGDGRPDPLATVDYCKQTGYVPPERLPDRQPQSPRFEQPGALPTELEQREQHAEGSEPQSDSAATPAEDAAPAAPAEGAAQ